MGTSCARQQAKGGTFERAPTGQEGILKSKFEIECGIAIYEFMSLSIMQLWELSGRVLDSRLKGRRSEPHRRHCVVVFEQDTFILA